MKQMVHVDEVYLGHQSTSHDTYIAKHVLKRRKQTHTNIFIYAIDVTFKMYRTPQTNC